MPKLLLTLIIQRFKLNSDQVSMVMYYGAFESEYGFVSFEHKFYVAYLSGADSNMKPPRLKQCAGLGDVNQLAAVGHELEA